jgi:hypothetical protein
MINITPQHKLDGIAQKLPKLSMELAVILGVAIDLEICCQDKYEDPDHPFSCPPTKEDLLEISSILRQTYLNIASLTGLDPCWKFEETKLKRRLVARATSENKMPNFYD